jgi:hypothetical protein
MPDSDLTAGDPTTSSTTGGSTTGGSTTGGSTTGGSTTGGSALPKTGKRRRQGGPQPLTVFTGSHGLQSDKPRAGEDPDQPDDTTTADPAGRPDLRR